MWAHAFEEISSFRRAQEAKTKWLRHWSELSLSQLEEFVLSYTSLQNAILDHVYQIYSTWIMREVKQIIILWRCCCVVRFRSSRFTRFLWGTRFRLKVSSRCEHLVRQWRSQRRREYRVNINESVTEGWGWEWGSTRECVGVGNLPGVGVKYFGRNSPIFRFPMKQTPMLSLFWRTPRPWNAEQDSAIFFTSLFGRCPTGNNTRWKQWPYSRDLMRGRESQHTHWCRTQEVGLILSSVNPSKERNLSRVFFTRRSCASIVTGGHEIKSQITQDMTPEPIEFNETVAWDIRIRGRDTTLIGVDEWKKDICPILSHIGHLPYRTAIGGVRWGEVKRGGNEYLVWWDLEGLTNFFHIEIVLCGGAVIFPILIRRIPIPHKDPMDIISLQQERVTWEPLWRQRTLLWKWISASFLCCSLPLPCKITSQHEIRWAREGWESNQLLQE